MTAGIVVAVIALVVALVVVAFLRSLAREQVRRAEAEQRRLRAVLDDVKEVAWGNRDLSPDLSTIIIDTIRTAERQHPELPR